MNRRGLLGLAVGGAAAAGAAYWLWPPPAPEFLPVHGLPGFRRIETGGGTSGGFDLAIGLGETRAASTPLAGRALCDVAFDGPPAGPGGLVIASFSDFFCPYCRTLDALLRDIAGAEASVRIVWHQVPLLGPPSQMAARGAIAAARQGAYDAYHARLIRTRFVPNIPYLREIAEAEGLDVPRFVADLSAPETDATLARSLAAFRAFGFVGTPGLVVGATLVNGVIAPRTLRSLIRTETAAPAPDGCTG